VGVVRYGTQRSREVGMVWSSYAAPARYIICSTVKSIILLSYGHYCLHACEAGGLGLAVSAAELFRINLVALRSHV
jgi:hypothetical protein